MRQNAVLKSRQNVAIWHKHKHKCIIKKVQSRDFKSSRLYSY